MSCLESPNVLSPLDLSCGVGMTVETLSPALRVGNALEALCYWELLELAQILDFTARISDD